jgi:hypothetical protein
MVRKILACLCLLSLGISLLLTACTNSEVDSADRKPVPPASMFVEHLAPFCGTQFQDKFTAGYYGSNPLDTTIHFYIVCHQGDTVYRDQWSGASMMKPDRAIPDSVQIARLHDSLHQLVEGRLSQPKDSLNLEPAGNQPVFGYAIGDQRAAFLYYSATDRQVHKL